MNGIYAEQWNKLRGIHRRLVLFFLIGPIGWLFIHFLFDPKDHHARLVMIYMIGWVLYGAWTTIQYWTWPCPRCGKPWQGDWLSHVGPLSMLLKHQCPHCGLALPR
jgi:hypothetical protein